MTQPAKAQEPSMEEILASIRRIISDDDPSKAAAPAQKPAAPRPAPMPRAVVPPPPVRAPEPVARDNAMGAGDMNSMLSAPVPREEPAADILDLTEQMTAPAANHDFKTIDGQPDIVFAESDPEVPPPDREPAPAPEPLRAPAMPDRGLMSGPTMAAVDSAFNTLAHTVLVQNARTLEDLVKEMLRPMLKTWLDDNLPGLVERIVRAEIERVSRGRNP
jgi:cell pole-organizing protein PopZ